MVLDELSPALLTVVQPRANFHIFRQVGYCADDPQTFASIITNSIAAVKHHGIRAVGSLKSVLFLPSCGTIGNDGIDGSVYSIAIIGMNSGAPPCIVRSFDRLLCVAEANTERRIPRDPIRVEIPIPHDVICGNRHHAVLILALREFALHLLLRRDVSQNRSYCLLVVENDRRRDDFYKSS